MTYVGRSYRRVYIPIKSRIPSSGILDLAKEYQGDYVGESQRMGSLTLAFDFSDKTAANDFIRGIRRDFSRWLNAGINSYTDWIYED